MPRWKQRTSPGILEDVQRRLRRIRSLLAVAFVATAVGCNALTGAENLDTNGAGTGTTPDGTSPTVAPDGATTNPSPPDTTGADAADGTTASTDASSTDAEGGAANCAKASDDCSTTADCCAGLYCKSTECRACGNAFTPCTTNEECCSGTCSFPFCNEGARP